MGENKGADDGVVVGLTEEQKQEMVRNQNFHKMRFWICCNLFAILFLLAAPFLIFFCDKMQYPRWTQYLYHYTGSQIFLLLIVLAISLAEVFYIFFYKRYRPFRDVKVAGISRRVHDGCCILLICERSRVSVS